MGMICTRCHRETPDELHGLRKLGAKTIADLCANWRCNDCLDEEETEAPARPRRNPYDLSEATHNFAGKRIKKRRRKP